MLEIGGVVPSRGKHYIDTAGVDCIHGLPQQLRIVAVVHDGVAAEGLRAAPAAQFPRNKRIGRAAGDAEVILQNEPAAVLCLHKVDAGDVAVNALGRYKALALRQIAAARKHKILRHNAVPDDLFVAVDVLQKQIQCIDPLYKPLVQRAEFLRCDDPGQRVEWKKPLLKCAVFVQAEFHAIPCQLVVDGLLMLH